MAVTRIGGLTVIQSNQNSGNQSITVPTDAEIIVVAASGYQNTNGYYSAGSVTLAGAALTVGRAQDSNTDAMMGAEFYKVSPATGSQTLAWDWLGSSSPVAGTQIAYAFYKGINTSAAIRSSGGQQTLTNSATTGSLTAETGDFVVAFGWCYGDGTITFTAGATEISEVAYNDDVLAYAEATPSGNVTVNITWTGDPDGGLAVLVLAHSIAGTLQTVTDSLSLSDAILRHKTLLPITDVLGLADAILRHKTLTIADSVGAVDSVKGNKTLTIIDAVVLAETIKALKTLIITDQIQLAELLDVLKGGILKSVADSVGLADSVLLNKMLAIADSVTLLDSASTPSRVIRALESIVLVDNAFVNKTLQITEAISVAEIVEVGAGSIKKTKLFLILGDLAVQLTGD